MKEIAQMVRDHIFQTVLKKAPKERIEELLRSVKCNKTVEVFRTGKEFSYFDLLDLLDATGIDVGMTIRMRDGEEVTFFPAHNFGETGGKPGTPWENKAAKKPYEAYEYNRGAITTPHWHPHEGGAHKQRLYQQGNLYAAEDDDALDEDGEDVIGLKARTATPGKITLVEKPCG
jgi:hypothetical protein